MGTDQEWTKGLELAKVARRDGPELDCAPSCTRRAPCPKMRSNGGGGERTNQAGIGTEGDYLLQAVQEPDPGDRAGDEDGGLDAGSGQVARLLPGNDLRMLWLPTAS